MILVTLGTQDKPFPRILSALEAFKEKGLINDEIWVQSGYTQFSSNILNIKDYYSQIELDELRQKADLIITHAGVGSILDSLKFKKKVIGVARLKQYGEHANDHQYEILDVFSKDGYILRCDNFDDLANIIQSAYKFTPKNYPFDNSKVLETILNAINN